MTAAEAQNYNLAPSYGSFNLSAGFSNDPRSATGRAGGDIHVDPLAGCPGGGWFANAPDFRLHYQAGSFPLTFYVRANGDTMLLVNAPNGNWYCNDDTDGLDPAIRFPSPASGQYDVWIGTFNRSRVQNTTVYVTETR
ncbi:peptidase S1 [Pararhodobacter sp. CCB-MM2]|uniref:peptidase S1 n=1 Tax=Pararhodobacter sp. CCB-MM2 TaxID=1786003 RepID=UPI001111C897|nr:peptidase S1 [Pararhodobacter sp. CCB-MM2]